MHSKHLNRPTAWAAAAWLLVLLLPAMLAGQDVENPAPVPGAGTCASWVTADVVALDQPFFWNRYGAIEPQGMMYALRRDVVDITDGDGLPPSDKPLTAGQVMLRRDKRPRPLVLRVNAGSCLHIKFQNLLSTTGISPERRIDEEAPKTRAASMHIVGMQLFSIADDGSYVGTNASSVVDPGGVADYYLYAQTEGGYVIHSMGAIAGGEGDGGSTSAGLFGALNVEPAGSVWYRSQVTQAEMAEGSTPGDKGYPILDYTARYQKGPYTGLPIFEMLDNGEIVHSDLTAVIVGGAQQGSTKVYPDRNEPFREFTIIFHDEVGAVQAFPQFYDRVLQFTLHGVRDAFAVNYGTGGAGAEVIANRLGVGPGYDCAECKYEEFFLTSWVVGDPAMVVDVPANVPCVVPTGNPNLVDKEPNYETKLNQLKKPELGVNCAPTPGPKATKAFFPDDPSNVYHSYLSDRVKFRNLHAGTDDHHIFHLHAHQWLHTPKSDLSSYRDSQAIGPGSAFTYEIAYGGSGNRNLTAGDSIFHCHFYPHFAQGMWSLWRVHDVLEMGTELDEKGRPAAGSRALPDGELATGSPIPGLVPMPGIPMAPLPANVTIAGGEVQLLDDINVLLAQLAAGVGEATNPGYPFYVPGLSGRRAPHPPLDTIHDGGLARHVVLDGTAHSEENRFSFAKDILTANVKYLSETGEPVEEAGMRFHELSGVATPTPGGVWGGLFKLNGLPRAPGAPYANPCPPGSPMRNYKAAEIQLDMTFNKAGWHYPQQRIITLLEDIAPTLAGTRPPEPFFFRAESGECIQFEITNLVPNEYQLDDFQVRTPTDILGQHIHLVKFDVTSSDGGGNGFNYEDGTFSPEEVVERLCAIRRTAFDGCSEPKEGECTFRVERKDCPVPVTMDLPIGAYNPDCDERPELWGAQTTVQRWWADPVLISDGSKDRTLRTVFTHDHFGPSSHQQAGLYAGLIVEKANTTWRQNETGDLLGIRADGGPTSWQATITDDFSSDQFREFLLEYADFQLAYEPGGPLCPDTRPVTLGGRGFIDTARSINPPGRQSVGPHPLYLKPVTCPLSKDTNPFPNPFGIDAPCPEAVSADDPGMGLVNYRNEPVALRIKDQSLPQQALGLGGDLSFVYETRTDRSDPEFNKLPYAPFLSNVPYGPLTKDLRPGDPFTPLMRVYEGDRVVIRTLVGAHEEEHVFTGHGLKWLYEPDWADSGWRNAFEAGISEWHDIEIPRIPSLGGSLTKHLEADFLYKPSTAPEMQWDGMWGLIRVYRGLRTDADAEGRLEVLNVKNPDAAVDETNTQEPYYTISEAEAADLGVLTGTSSQLLGEATTEKATLSPSLAADPGIRNSAGRIRTGCPAVSVSALLPLRIYDITAVAAAEVLANDPIGMAGLVYNSRPDAVQTFPIGSAPGFRNGPLYDPTAIMFVFTNDLDYSSGRPILKPGIRREPLILRARAGECIRVTLRNDIWEKYQDMDGWTSVTNIVENFNANDLFPSMDVGLHPQLVAFDIRNSDGANVGINPKNFGKQTVSRNQKRTYFWYAGDFNVGAIKAVPIEFGSTGLTSSDPIKHANKGAMGAMIIEPPSASWVVDGAPGSAYPGEITRASATVTTSDVGTFREAVLVVQDNINLRYKDDAPVESLVFNEDPGESGQKAVNYRTDPLWFRLGHAPDTPGTVTRNIKDYHLVLSNNWIGGADPETPVFTANVGQATRFRMVVPAGHDQGHTLDIHGHLWEELPYVSQSRRLGFNGLSEVMGARSGMGPGMHYDSLLLNGAGGKGRAWGDFLYRDYAGWLLDDGIWGLFRVIP